MTKTRFEVLTWNAVYSMLLSQAEKIRKDNFKPDVILGVSRGGLIPARIHSDLLENPNLATIRAECYVGIGEAKSEPTLREPLSACVDGKNVLIVDEVADTGRSLKLVKAHVLQRGASETRVATLFWKTWSIVKPDYFEKETEFWVVFPWDVKETVRKAFETRGGTSVSQFSSTLEAAGLPKSLFAGFLKEMAEEKSC